MYMVKYINTCILWHKSHSDTVHEAGEGEQLRQSNTQCHLKLEPAPPVGLC